MSNVKRQLAAAERENEELRRALEAHHIQVETELRLLRLQQENLALSRRLVSALGRLEAEAEAEKR